LNVPCSWSTPFIDPDLREGEGEWVSARQVPSRRY
jgi:hypothetical protein